MDCIHLLNSCIKKVYMLETIIGSKSRAAIIKLFYLNEGKKFHIRGVARLLGISSNQARKEMIRLASAGLLKSEKAGNAILYFTNTDLPFHDELLGIVKKTAGFESIIKKKLARINGIRFAFIFGSYAEGKFNPKSDIDIMIIGKPDMVELNEAINKVEKEIRRSVQYMVYPLDEFNSKRGYGFVKNVMNKKKIFLIGDLDGLEQA